MRDSVLGRASLKVCGVVGGGLNGAGVQREIVFGCGRRESVKSPARYAKRGGVVGALDCARYVVHLGGGFAAAVSADV